MTLKPTVGVEQRKANGVVIRSDRGRTAIALQ